MGRSTESWKPSSLPRAPPVPPAVPAVCDADQASFAVSAQAAAQAVGEAAPCAQNWSTVPAGALRLLHRKVAAKRQIRNSAPSRLAAAAACSAEAVANASASCVAQDPATVP